MFKQEKEYEKRRNKLKEDNPDKFYAFKSDFFKLNKILNNSPNKIKNYYRTLVYLDTEDLENLNNVKDYLLFIQNISPILIG